MCEGMGTISSGEKSISGRRSIDSVTATAGGSDRVANGPLAYISATAVFGASVRGRRAARLPSYKVPYSAYLGVSLMFAVDDRARQQQYPQGKRHVASACPSNEVVQALSPKRVRWTGRVTPATLVPLDRMSSRSGAYSSAMAADDVLSSSWHRDKPKTDSVVPAAGMQLSGCTPERPYRCSVAHPCRVQKRGQSLSMDVQRPAAR